MKKEDSKQKEQEEKKASDWMKDVAKNLESPDKNDTKDKKVTAPPKISEKE